MRLGLYRRMADIRALDEVEALEEEFKDRFGPPPEAVYNLFYQLKIKLLAEKAGLASINSRERADCAALSGGQPARLDLPELDGRGAGRKDRLMDALPPGQRLAGSPVGLILDQLRKLRRAVR